jgi:hypothetical protein
MLAEVFMLRLEAMFIASSRATAKRDSRFEPFDTQSVPVKVARQQPAKEDRPRRLRVDETCKWIFERRIDDNGTA